MLYTLGAEAEKYYASAEKLTPLIDRDSRAALEVLVAIYHRLLKKIAGRDSDVFSERASVPGIVKIAILLRGMAKTFWNRVVA
jgi:phytoene synthase